MNMHFDYLRDKYHVKAEGILHLGAHTGQEAETYRACGIKQVIWVEADPEVYGRLVQHLKGYPENVALRACVSDKDGERVLFNVASNDGQSSSFLDFGTHATAHPDVTFIKSIDMMTERVDSLLIRNGIHLKNSSWFLTADLQGAELRALKGMGDLLHNFDYAYVEVNDQELYRGAELVGKVDDYLARFDFEGIQTAMTPWGWGDKFYMRKKR